MSFKNFGSNQPPSADAGGGGGDNKPTGNYPISRQPSIYSLTFDEFQSTMGGIGKDFGSMNMDELLKNIWSAEETQTMASSSVGMEANGGLQKQGSLTLPRTLSQKTVDQVWKDMSKEFSVGKDGKIGTGVTDNMPQRQQTLGEITLEEFLVRVGVVREDSTQISGKLNNVNGGFFGELPQAGSNTGFGIGFQQGGRGPNLIGNWPSNDGNQIGIQPFPQQQTHQQQQQRQRQPILPKQYGLEYGAQMPLQSGGQGLINGLAQGGGGIGVVGVGGPVGVATGSPANQLSSDGIGKSSGDTSSVSPVPYVFNGSLRGRKFTTLEKVAERRQRRMIKNRESAARSRARKQAYTTELEAEIAKLNKENEELQKKHAQMMKLQENQDSEMMNIVRGAKKRCLRKTQTGPL
ncbi:ABSCISIC ACID-INSENSITIVE 5-like protein 5 [Hibiscus syriacus]|uniref:ABSCISIC ACID-INSENSITIVE 5-like protein 5 n=1 Tax=Hibiscus syriacus TaxID=106335 RepID=A0A6A2XH49_HIBSY|nr:bZIP transcription factor 46-like [Hibiscus syriacus]KAE8669110.1 ABSCISIC ACID-INSENSITIVE 5-like protein 5 [Hibiscus syriacus]